MNRERGFYHCFGCGEHGNAISFLMKYENLPFVDAVEKLASEFSMQVRYEGGAPKPKSGKPRLSEIMQRAMEFIAINSTATSSHKIISMTADSKRDHRAFRYRFLTRCLA